MTTWNVSVWVCGALRPVSSKDFTGRTAEADANRYADQLRAQIQGRSTHRVHVTEVVNQS